MNLFADIRITREEGDPPFVLGMIAFMRWASRHPVAAATIFDAVERAYKAGSRDLEGSDAALRDGHAEAYGDLLKTLGAGDGIAFLGALNTVSLRLDAARKAPAAGTVVVLHERPNREAVRAGDRRRREPRKARIRS